MNHFQKNHYRQQSRLAATGYIPASACIGKTFVFGSCHYEVIQHNPERWTFTLSIINHGNAHIEKDETFVQHHCTPPQPRAMRDIPCRPAPLATSEAQWRGDGGEVPRYLPFSAPIIGDKTEVDYKMTQTDQANTTLEVDITPAFQNHLVTGDIKNQGEWHRCLVIARELRTKQLWGGVLPLHICGDVSAIHYQLSVHGQLPYMKLVGNQWHCYLDAAAANTPVSETPSVEAHSVTTVTVARSEAQPDKPLDPAYYLDQEFTFTVNDSTYTARVQAWNERRQQFRLYSTTGGCWYREPTFVYEHCQPTAAPVVREPLPVITVDPRRFSNLMSLSDKRRIIAVEVQATGVPQADPLRTCGCCGQHLTIIGIQTYPAKYNRKDHILVECRNADCSVYRWTASSDSHADSCETAKCEALKKEQTLYADERAQYWLGEENRLRENGKGHTKAARIAQRKSQYWLDQLNKLEGLR